MELLLFIEVDKFHDVILTDDIHISELNPQWYPRDIFR